MLSRLGPLSRRGPQGEVMVRAEAGDVKTGGVSFPLFRAPPNSNRSRQLMVCVPP